MTVRAEIRPIPEPPREVVLTMPYDVAVTLLGLVCNVGGDPSGTYRSDTNAILRALIAAGTHEPSPYRFDAKSESRALPR